MAQQKLIVVADQSDTDAVKREQPVFELRGKKYFHGDTFVPPEGFALNMEGFQGRGMRFSYEDRYMGDDNKEVVIPRNTILPVALDAAENIVETPPAQVKKPKTPKAV